MSAPAIRLNMTSDAHRGQAGGLPDWGEDPGRPEYQCCPVSTSARLVKSSRLSQPPGGGGLSANIGPAPVCGASSAVWARRQHRWMRTSWLRPHQARPIGRGQPSELQPLGVESAFDQDELRVGARGGRNTAAPGDERSTPGLWLLLDDGHAGTQLNCRSSLKSVQLSTSGKCPRWSLLSTGHCPPRTLRDRFAGGLLNLPKGGRGDGLKRRC